MALIHIIKKPEARKLFGKAELKIIEKQLLGINLKPSEKTRLSRDIKPKLKIIKEMSHFQQEFELKKGQEIKYLINQTKEEILKSQWKNQIKKIIVFGSYIDKTLRHNSDIDLSVEFKKIDKKEATKFRIEMASKIPEKIQAQAYNLLPKKIKNEIDTKGRIIYEK